MLNANKVIIVIKFFNVNLHVDIEDHSLNEVFNGVFDSIDIMPFVNNSSMFISKIATNWWSKFIYYMLLIWRN